jgi:hypothetical protein
MEIPGLTVAAETDVQQRLGRSCGGGVSLFPPPDAPPDRPPTHFGRMYVRVVRWACVAFWLFLTLLLLSPDPRALLGLERLADRLPNPKVAHVVCFTLLAMLVHASRFPLRRGLLVGMLVAYAASTEGLQYFVPNRTAALADVALNLSGLALGTVLWRAAGQAALAWRHRIGLLKAATVEIKTMYNVQRFRIVTVEGLLSHDTFVIAAERSTPVKAGCLVVINERDGGLVTVHRDRLVPVEPAGPPILYHESRTACLKCGRVEGVIQDHVSCPHHGDVSCGLLEAQRARVQLSVPTASR